MIGALVRSAAAVGLCALSAAPVLAQYYRQPDPAIVGNQRWLENKRTEREADRRAEQRDWGAQRRDRDREDFQRQRDRDPAPRPDVHDRDRRR